MKKFILKISLFFALMAVIDVMAGWCFTWLRSKARGGQTYKNEYIANLCEDDILILGSSKADHHYVPSVIEDSLEMTCYNAGEMGCGIIPAYVRYRMVRERRKPKLVLYEVTPSYDYLEEGEYSQYLGPIRQYTDRKDVLHVYLDFSDRLEGLRLLSNLYRNNSKIVMNLRDVFKAPDNWKGYEPLNGRINIDRNKKMNQEKEAIKNRHLEVVDSLKYSYMERLIAETTTDSVPLVFVLSPKIDVNSENLALYEQAFLLSEKYSIPLLNNRNCEGIANMYDFFQDETHLNHTGAVAYTQHIIPQLRSIINK